MNQLLDAIVDFFTRVAQSWSTNKAEFIAQNPLLILGILLVVFFWVISILWTAKDIAARTNSFFGQILAILLVGIGTPFIWLPLYFLLRPLRFKWDRIWWREATTAQTTTCPSCAMKNPLHHDFCIACGQKLVIDCKECKHNYPWVYDYCPQCGAPNIE